MISTGLYNVGNAPLAIIACAKIPSSKTICSPVSTSVAIQRKGIGSLSKSLTSLTCCVNFDIKLKLYNPFESPEGNPNLKLLKGSVNA